MAPGGLHSEKGPHRLLNPTRLCSAPRVGRPQRGQGRSSTCPPVRGPPPTSLEALHSSQGPRGWVDGVPRARPAFPVTSLCTDATHRILMCCLSDTHQSDVQTAAPRELLSAGKQVTGLPHPRDARVTCSPACSLLPEAASPCGAWAPRLALQAEACCHQRSLAPTCSASSTGSAAAAHTRSPIVLCGPGQPSSRRTPSALAERRPVVGLEVSACSRGPPARGFGVAVSRRPGTYLTTPPAAHTPTAVAPGWLPGHCPGWPSMCGRCPCELEGWHPTLHAGEESVGSSVVPLSRGAAYPPSQGTARQGHEVSTRPVLTGAQAGR